MRGALDSMVYIYIKKKNRVEVRHPGIQGDLVKMCEVTVSAVYSLDAIVQAQAHRAKNG